MPSAAAVAIGSTVTVTDVLHDRQQTFQLVDGTGDPQHGIVSGRSPVGRALTGHHVGDVVAVAAPSGQRELRVVALA